VRKHDREGFKTCLSLDELKRGCQVAGSL